MEFGYEERSRRLIERLDRIQNYLQSLPPLPKIGSVSTSEAVGQSVDSERSRIPSASSQRSDESGDSVGSTTSAGSVSTRPCKSIPKSDRSELLQQSQTMSSEVSKPNVDSNMSVVETARTKSKKKRVRENKVIDPLRPTERRSFGVDIGQGINMINYIKQNAGSDARNKRLARIITKVPETGLHSVSSMERFYKQSNLTVDTSSTSLILKNREAELSKTRAGGNKHISLGGTQVSNSNYASPSDMDKYRIRIQERAVELPHHYGLDSLQELFVPYTEHESYPEYDFNSNHPSLE